MIISRTNSQNEVFYRIPTETALWYSSFGLELFQKLNFRQGDVVLDFGCWVGNYTIPAALVVGETGKVIAIDKDQESIRELILRAKKFNLQNIQAKSTLGELSIDLPSESVDFILFFDVIHNICRTDGIKPFQKLLHEFHRILKPNGTFLIQSNHLKDIEFNVLELNKIISEVFLYSGELHTRLIHWNKFELGIIYIYKHKDIKNSS